MSVSLNKEDLKLSKFVARDKYTTWIEQEVLVPDIKPDVMKIIRVEAVPFIEESQIANDSIKVTGRINYYVLYRSMDGGQTSGITIEYPFAQTINTSLAKSGMLLDVDINARNVIYSLPNERKIMLKTEIIFDYSIMELVDISLPVGIEDKEGIEYKMENDIFNNVIDMKCEALDISEEIILPEQVSSMDEIVKVSSQIKNTDYKISYNKILVKGDVELKLTYLKSEDTVVIGNYSLVVPFAGMIEFGNISDQYKFDIKYTLQNLQIIMGGDNSNVLNVQGSILTRVIMYEEKDISHIVDFYSTDKELAYDPSNVAVIKNKVEISKEINVKEKIGVIDENSSIVEFEVDTKSLSTSVSGSNLYISGTIKVPVIYKNNATGAVDIKNFEIVTENTIPLGKDIDEKNVLIEIIPLNADIKLNGANVEANIVVKVNVQMENIDNVTVIEEITEQEAIEDDFNSMYIYIVKKGDNLWKIAKKYKTTVAKIANVNNINDENKLEIGQKLLLIR